MLKGMALWFANAIFLLQFWNCLFSATLERGLAAEGEVDNARRQVLDQVVKDDGEHHHRMRGQGHRGQHEARAIVIHSKWS